MNFDSNQHPRGQADNAGQFRDKENSAPEASLPARSPRLSAPQQELLRRANQMPPGWPGILVSGHEYRTALSLERLNLGSVRYQGPSLGWFIAQAPESQ